MSKMNWHRVRWENRAARQGSEWASSDSPNPAYPGSRFFPANETASKISSERKTKKKKKKKRKAQNTNTQAQPSAKATPTRTLKTQKCGNTHRKQGSSGPPGNVAAQSAPGLTTRSGSPRSVQKSRTIGSGNAVSARPLVSVPDLQKLTIRLYKALGESRMLDAATLASDIRAGALLHSERARDK